MSLIYHHHLSIYEGVNAFFLWCQKFGKIKLGNSVFVHLKQPPVSVKLLVS